MKILGIDPGLASVGYGVLTVKNPKKGDACFVACGLIKTEPSTPFPLRLKKISQEIAKLIKIHQPDLVAIESIFFFRNLKTFIPVSRAEGVIILETAKKGVPLVEFSPLQVKAKITGYGRAEKEEVKEKILEILSLKEIPGSDDVADAVGVALCAVISLKT